MVPVPERLPPIETVPSVEFVMVSSFSKLIAAAWRVAPASCAA